MLLPQFINKGSLWSKIKVTRKHLFLQLGREENIVYKNRLFFHGIKLIICQNQGISGVSLEWAVSSASMSENNIVELYDLFHFSIKTPLIIIHHFQPRRSWHTSLIWWGQDQNLMKTLKISIVNWRSYSSCREIFFPYLVNLHPKQHHGSILVAYGSKPLECEQHFYSHEGRVISQDILLPGPQNMWKAEGSLNRDHTKKKNFSRFFFDCSYCYYWISFFGITHMKVGV